MSHFDETLNPDVRQAPDNACPALAIRVQLWRLRTGEPVLIRPIQQQDRPSLARFHESLSDETVYLRYFKLLKLSTRTAPERLARICAADTSRESVLVADYLGEGPAGRAIIGVGRLNAIPASQDCEIAVVVSDAFQNLGLGSRLLRRLLECARERRYERVVANMLPENDVVRGFLRRQTFPMRTQVDCGVLTVEIDIKQIELDYD